MLPGGLWREHGVVERNWAFRPLCGHVELDLWAARSSATSRPARITALLAATLAAPGAGAEVARALCVADRQFLLARLAAALGAGETWLTAACHACGEPFDAYAPLGELPVKPAGAGYPFAEVETSAGRLTLRTPRGADQEAICGLDEAALEALVARCVVAVDGVPTDAAPVLTEADLEAVDAALQAMSPEAAREIAAVCPGCGTECAAVFDLAELALSRLADPILDVHVLAAAYHWSEREILDLPRSRRLRYLRLIDLERGMGSDQA